MDSTKLWIKLMDIARKYWGCHQFPERSFFFRGYQFPVCARYTGIMIGYIVSIILLLCKVFFSWKLSAAFLLFMLIDAGLQYQFGVMSTNNRRLLSGMLFGIGFWELIACIIRSIIL